MKSAVDSTKVNEAIAIHEAITRFAELHCPDGELRASANASDYDRNGVAIVDNLRALARLIRRAARTVH